MNLLLISYLLISESSSDCQISNCKTCSIKSSNICIDCNPGFTIDNRLGCIKMDSNNGDFTSKVESEKIMNQIIKSSWTKNNFTENIEKSNSDDFDFEKFSEECKNCAEFENCSDCKTKLSKFKARILDSTCGYGYYYSYGTCYVCMAHCFDCYNGHSCYDCDSGYYYDDYDEVCRPNSSSSSSIAIGTLLGIIFGTVPSIIILCIW